VSIPATDPLSGVIRGEYFIGTDPGAGNGTPMPLSSGKLTAVRSGQGGRRPEQVDLGDGDEIGLIPA
jgi:hypothetical protein